MREDQQDLWQQIGIQEGLRRYSQIRKRLQRPPNAVVDLGIDLKRPKHPILVETQPPQSATPEDKEAAIRKQIAAIVSQYPPVPKRLTISVVFSAAANAFDVTLEQVRGQSRRPIYAFPRFVGIYLTRKLLTYHSFPQIGRFLGGRDHTSVLNGFKRIQRKLAVDHEFAAKIAAIEADLLSNYDYVRPAAAAVRESAMA